MSLTREKLENGDYNTKLVYDDDTRMKPPEPATKSSDVDRYAAEMKEYFKWKEDRERKRKAYIKDRDRLNDLFWEDLMAEFFPNLPEDKVWKVRTFIYERSDSRSHSTYMAEEMSGFL